MAADKDTLIAELQEKIVLLKAQLEELEDTVRRLQEVRSRMD